MAPLMGCPSIIHHGVHCNILNCANKYFERHLSQRVTLMLFSSGSLAVCAPKNEDPKNEILVRLTRDGGRNLMLLSSIEHCVCVIER